MSYESTWVDCEPEDGSWRCQLGTHQVSVDTMKIEGTFTTQGHEDGTIQMWSGEVNKFSCENNRVEGFTGERDVLECSVIQ